MKRFMLINVSILLALVSYTQVQKGDISLGANVGLLSQTGDAEVNSFSYTTLNANVQYYLTDNISIGVGPSFARTKVLDGAAILTTTSLNFSAQYSFLTANGKVLPYFGGGLNFYTNSLDFDFNKFIAGNTNFGIDNIKYKYKRQIATVSVGIKFFITERINIDNNFTFGSVIKQDVEIDLGGAFGGFLPGGMVSAEGPTGDKLIQFTVGFGYIIGARGT